ncbi:MAG: MurR/RpiR family transcriptional regulator [Bacillota bacterium]|nr:MurR/RpiR family transcriptional regulator [Bacillota bacterium]
MIFTYEQISKLNDTELIVYNYIIKNVNKVLNMNIRELALESHVSTATITRFCHKLDCDGFVEFKIELKRFNEVNKMPEIDDEITMLNQFFEYSKGKEFLDNINEAVDYIVDSNFVVCLGVGQSGSMARYAARFFSNIGYYSQYIDDPFYPAPTDRFEKCLLIAFSNSGETREVIDQLRLYRGVQSKIISITNETNSTIAKMSDLTIPYFIKKIILPNTKNISSQVPVVYIIERICRKLQTIKNIEIDE